MRLPNGLPADLQITSSQLLPGGVGFLTGNQATGRSNAGQTVFRGSIYKTNDGGNNWKRSTNAIGTDIKYLAFIQSLPTGSAADVLAFAVGTNGTLLKSFDSGFSWDQVNWNYTLHDRDFNDVVTWWNGS